MSSPLERPLVRYGIGFVGATTIAVVAFVFFDGTLRLALLGLAVVDAVVTPQVLRLAAEREAT
jgi:hypothetical protein